MLYDSLNEIGQSHELEREDDVHNKAVRPRLTETELREDNYYRNDTQLMRESSIIALIGTIKLGLGG